MKKYIVLYKDNAEYVLGLNNILTRYYQKDILSCLGYGGDICEITIPEDSVVQGPYLESKVILEKILKPNYKNIRGLIEEGADPRIGNDYVLRWAALNGHDKLVEYLITLGADVTSQNNEAILTASAAGHYKVVHVLLDNGADIHVEEDMPLVLATLRNSFDTVAALLRRGASSKAQDYRAYYIAADHNYVGVGELLKGRRL